MPNLDTVLSDTMLFSAYRGRDPRPTPSQTSFSPGRRIYGVPSVPQGVDDEDARIWSWRLGDHPAQLKDVECLVAGMGYGAMTVFEKVEFGAVRLKLENDTVVPLNISTENLVRRYDLHNGSISEGASTLYPLEAKIDVSMMHVFAIVFPDGPSNGSRRATEEELGAEQFMPIGTGAAEEMTAGPQQVRRIVVRPLRVLVALSLVCGKGKSDFEPGGALLAGRLNPHLMVMANWPVKEVEGSVTMERPSTSSMTHTGFNPEIEACLFRENNDPDSLAALGARLVMGGGLIAAGAGALLASQAPNPMWRNLFDDFIPGWQSNTYTMVRPDIPSLTLADAVRVHKVSSSAFSGSSIENSLREVIRVPRQGAFDNIHLAPTHASAPSHRPFPGLDKIYMAPVCEHDCLHMHWRWADYGSGPHIRGWSATANDWTPTATDRIPGRPYSAAAAPMVPDNQTLLLSPTGASAFRYEIKAYGHSAASPQAPIPAGSWTMIFHHGCAYSLKLVWPGTVAATMLNNLVTETPDFPGTGGLSEAGKMYWGLRYCGFTSGGRHTTHEQLEVLKAGTMRAP